MSFFTKRLQGAVTNLNNNELEGAFNEAKSLMRDMSESEEITPLDIQQFCHVLDELAIKGYAYSALEPLYSAAVNRFLPKINLEMQSDILGKMARAHRILGYDESTLQLAATAFHKAKASGHADLIAQQHHRLSVLEQTCEFGYFRKYAERLAGLTPENAQLFVKESHEFFLRAFKKLAVMMNTMGHWVEDDFILFYHENKTFLTMLITQMNKRIRVALMRLKKPDLGFTEIPEAEDFTWVLDQALGLLGSLLMQESCMIQQGLLKKPELAWVLRNFLEDQLQSKEYQDALKSLADFKDKSDKFNHLKNEFNQPGYWINLAKKSQAYPARWEKHQPALIKARDTFKHDLQSTSLFTAIKRYRGLEVLSEKNNAATKNNLLQKKDKEIDLNNNNNSSSNNNNNPLSVSQFPEIIDRESMLTLFKIILTELTDVLGEGPCAWQMCFKGSYARGDIAPFSDVDLFLLIKEESKQLHPYFQALITGFHHQLLSLGDSWVWEESPRKNLDRDILECSGLSIDSGDREHLLIDYPRNKAGLNEEILREKLLLLDTPERLATWVMQHLAVKEEINEDWITAFSLLHTTAIYSSAQGERLLNEYQALLATVDETIVARYGAQRLSQGLRIDEFCALRLGHSPLKKYLQLLTLTLLCGYYHHRKNLILPEFSLDAWQKALTGYWHPSFLKKLLAAWEELHQWRCEHQSRKASSDILFKDLTSKQQIALNEVYDTLLAPLFHTLLAYDFSAEQITNFNPWQAYGFELVQQWHEVSEKSEKNAEKAKKLAELIQLLCVAWRSEAPVVLSPTLIQPVWQEVASYLLKHWQATRLHISDPNVLELSPWHQQHLGDVVRTLLKAGADLDRPLVETNQSLLETALADSNPCFAFFLIECGAGRGPALGSLLLNYLKKRQGEPQWKTVVCQAKVTLGHYHPAIAWSLACEMLFESGPPHPDVIQQLELPSGWTGRMEGTDTKTVYLKPALMKAMLNPSTVLSWFSKKENLKKSNRYGLRTVSNVFFEGQHFFLKWYPEAPDREESVQQLTYKLFGCGVPQGELFRYIDASGQIQPVWISQGIEGYNAQEVLNALSDNLEVRAKSNLTETQHQEGKGAFDKIEDDSFAIQFFIATLFCQEDGKPDNLILQPIRHEGKVQSFRLIAIDNDHAFFDPVVLDKDGKPVLQLKSLIYCLNHMKRPLHPEVVKRFLSLDAYDTLQAWLDALLIKEQRYQSLFNNNDNAHQQSQLKFQFPLHSIPKLWERWNALKNILATHPHLTAMAVLHEVIPLAGRRYEAALADTSDINQRFANISQNQYTTTQIGATITHYKTRSRIIAPPSQNIKINVSEKAYYIEAAKKELEWVCKFAQIQIDKTITAFGEKRFTGNNGFFELFQGLILSNHKSRVLEKIDWRLLEKPQQEAFLKVLIQGAASSPFMHMTLNHCSTLMDRHIKALLRNSPSLQNLYISGAPYITDTGSISLIRYNSDLTTLELHDLPNLMGFNPIAIFPTLEKLVIYKCSLKQIDLQAPRLRYLDIKNCAVEQVKTRSQCLETILISDCGFLREEGLFGLANNGTFIKKVSWPKTLQWSEPELVKRHPWLLAFPLLRAQRLIRAIKKAPIPYPERTFSSSITEELYALEQSYVTFVADMILESESTLKTPLLAASSDRKNAVECSLLPFKVAEQSDGKEAVTATELFSSCTDSLKGIAWYLWLKTAPHEAAKAVPILLFSLQDRHNSDVRRDVATALGEAAKAAPGEAERIVNGLLPLLKDGDWHVRCAAASALAEAAKAMPGEAERIINGLLPLLKDGNYDVRCAAAAALGEAAKAASSEAEQIVNGLLPLLKDGNYDVRCAAAAALGEAVKAAPGEAERIINILLPLLKEGDMDVRGRAAIVLGEAAKAASSEAERIVNGLLPLLKEGEYVRRDATAALGEAIKAASSEAERIINGLLPLLKEGDKYVRRDAAAALGEAAKAAPREAERIINGLLPLLKEGDRDVRHGATAALAEAAKAAPGEAERIINGLLPLLKEGDNVQRSVATALGEAVKAAPREAERLINGLLPLLKEGDYAVRGSAATVLAEVVKAVPREAERIVNGLLPLLKDKDVYVRSHAATVLGEVLKAVPREAERIVNGLLPLLKDKEEYVRWSAAEALVEAVNAVPSGAAERIVNGLLPLLEDGVRDSAATALGEAVKAASSDDPMDAMLSSLKNAEIEYRIIRTFEKGCIKNKIFSQPALSFPCWRLLRDPKSTALQIQLAGLLLCDIAWTNKADFLERYVNLIQQDRVDETVGVTKIEEPHSLPKNIHQISRIQQYIQMAKDKRQLILTTPQTSLDLIVEILTAILEQKIPLNSLTLQGFKDPQTQQGAALLVKFLASQPTLETLDISNNDWGKLGQDKFLSLIKSLLPCKQLKALHLQEACLGINEARQLSLLLAGFNQLQTLSLGGNALDGEALQLILLHLPKTHALTSLSLSHNFWGPIGFTSLAKWLPDAPHQFHSLYLSECCLTTAGLKELHQALTKSPFLKLRELTLDKNALGDESIPLLLDLLAQQRQITYLEINGNAFTFAGLKQLQQEVLALFSRFNVNLQTCLKKELKLCWLKQAESADQSSPTLISIWDAILALYPDDKNAAAHKAQVLQAKQQQHMEPLPTASLVEFSASALLLPFTQLQASPPTFRPQSKGQTFWQHPVSVPNNFPNSTTVIQKLLSAIGKESKDSKQLGDINITRGEVNYTISNINNY